MPTGAKNARNLLGDPKYLFHFLQDLLRNSEHLEYSPQDLLRPGKESEHLRHGAGHGSRQFQEVIGDGHSSEEREKRLEDS